MRNEQIKAQQLGSKSLNSSICSNLEQLCKSLHPYVFRVSPAPAVADLSFTRFTRSVVQYTTYINLHYCCLRCCFNVQTLKNTGPKSLLFLGLNVPSRLDSRAPSRTSHIFTSKGTLPWQLPGSAVRLHGHEFHATVQWSMP